MKKQHLFLWPSKYASETLSYRHVSCYNRYELRLVFSLDLFVGTLYTKQRWPSIYHDIFSSVKIISQKNDLFQIQVWHTRTGEEPSIKAAINSNTDHMHSDYAAQCTDAPVLLDIRDQREKEVPSLTSPKSHLEASSLVH